MEREKHLPPQNLSDVVAEAVSLKAWLEMEHAGSNNLGVVLA